MRVPSLLLLGVLLVAVPAVFAAESVASKARDAEAFVCGKRFVTFRSSEIRVTVLKAKILLIRGPIVRKTLVESRFIEAYWSHFSNELREKNPDFTRDDLERYIRQREQTNPEKIEAMANYLFENKYRGTDVSREDFAKFTGTGLAGHVQALISPKRWRRWEISDQTHGLLVRCLN